MNFLYFHLKTGNLFCMENKWRICEKKVAFFTTYGRFRKEESNISFRGRENEETKTFEPFLY